MELDTVIEKLKYQRVAMVVELSSTDCAAMYDALLLVRSQVTHGPKMPGLRRKVQGMMAKLEQRERADHWPEAPSDDSIHITRAELKLLIDAVLSLTEEA